jgi:hypothetical protein
VPAPGVFCCGWTPLSSVSLTQNQPSLQTFIIGTRNTIGGTRQGEHIYREDFYFVDLFDVSTLHGRAPLATRRIQIFLVNQHAWRLITFGMK